MMPTLQVREWSQREVESFAQSHRMESEFLFVGWPCTNRGCSFMPSTSSFWSANYMPGTVFGWHGVEQGKHTWAGVRPKRKVGPIEGGTRGQRQL